MNNGEPRIIRYKGIMSSGGKIYKCHVIDIDGLLYVDGNTIEEFIETQEIEENIEKPIVDEPTLKEEHEKMGS